jgi:ATP-dependent DNA ligase
MQRPPLVALRDRCRYILRRDRVPLHPALQPDRRQGSARAGDDWLHEVKFDGYRVQAHKAGSRIVIYSRYAEHKIMRTPQHELRFAAGSS